MLVAYINLNKTSPTVHYVCCFFFFSNFQLKDSVDFVYLPTGLGGGGGGIWAGGVLDKNEFLKKR